MVKKPKDIEYRAVYEPDMARMVKALRVLLEYNPGNPRKENDNERNSILCRQEQRIQTISFGNEKLA